MTVVKFNHHKICEEILLTEYSLKLKTEKQKYIFGQKLRY